MSEGCRTLIDHDASQRKNASSAWPLSTQPDRRESSALWMKNSDSISCIDAMPRNSA
jgi:hypothetical protein